MAETRHLAGVTFSTPNAVNPIMRLWFVMLALLLLAPAFVVAQQPAGTSNQWEVLQGCQLAPNEFVDGDSFHVLHEGRQYIFRLYFVDAAETDATLRDRIQDQAAHLGIAQEDVTHVGKLATAFVREKLTGTNFTVTTRWQNAMSRSSLSRFYCGIEIGGENLAEQLVANGLARIYGIRANFPGQRSTTFINQLKNLELSAREKKLGVWDESQFPRVEAKEGTASASQTASATGSPAESSPDVLDLNTATREELMTLPGIGKVMSERILTNRPFSSVDDLRRVSGIGAITLEKLRPLVQVAPGTDDSAPKAE